MRKQGKAIHKTKIRTRKKCYVRVRRKNPILKLDEIPLTDEGRSKHIKNTFNVCNYKW